jgi:hypothetical protein
MEVRNSTPFAAGFTVLFDADAAERLCLAVRATWSIGPNGALELAEVQPPLLPLDVLHGEPGKSSIKYEADLGYPKLATDVALVGSAVAARPASGRQEVTFRVGPVSQRALVLGERISTGLFRPDPRPFQRVPLRWELAAGGTDASPADPRHHGMELRNPVGRGFRAKQSQLPKKGYPLPQILRVDGDENEPVGFGFIAEHWLPRRKYGGTYDEAWRETRCPLLPVDFDPRFHNKAAPGLTAPRHLAGGEPVEVRGCTPSGILRSALPRLRLRAEAVIDRSAEPVSLHLDGVTVDTDAMQLRCLWRGDLVIHKRLMKLRRVVFAEEKAA